MSNEWRTDGTLHHGLVCDGRLVGMAFSLEDAAKIVRVMNGKRPVHPVESCVPAEELAKLRQELAPPNLLRDAALVSLQLTELRIKLRALRDEMTADGDIAPHWVERLGELL